MDNTTSSYMDLQGKTSSCSIMMSADVQEDHIYLNAFPHSLMDKPKHWLYYLASRFITS